MASTGPVHNLTDLIEHIERMADRPGKVTLRDVMNAVGRRSFGPWLLLAGFLTVSPIGGIPGLPTILGIVIFLIAAQLLFRGSHFWLPGWILRRSISASRLRKAAGWFRKPARFVDRFLKPRMEFFTGRTGTYTIAVLCVVVALGLPPMEFVPFSAAGAGLALILFGLSLVANDGLLTVLGIVFMVVTYGFVGWQLFTM